MDNIMTVTDKSFNSFDELLDLLKRGGEAVLKYNGNKYSMVRFGGSEARTAVAVWHDLSFEELGEFILFGKQINDLLLECTVDFRSDRQTETVMDPSSNESSNKSFASAEEFYGLLKRGGSIVLNYNGSDISLIAEKAKGEEEPSFVSVANWLCIPHAEVGEVLIDGQRIKDIAVKSEVLFRT